MIVLNEKHFIFDSVTAAQKAKAVLISAGIGARISKAPEKYSKKGCSHSVAANSADAAEVLRRAGIKPKRVY